MEQYKGMFVRKASRAKSEPPSKSPRLSASFDGCEGGGSGVLLLSLPDLGVFFPPSQGEKPCPINRPQSTPPHDPKGDMDAVSDSPSSAADTPALSPTAKAQGTTGVTLGDRGVTALPEQHAYSLGFMPSLLSGPAQESSSPDQEQSSSQCQEEPSSQGQEESSSQVLSPTDPNWDPAPFVQVVQVGHSTNFQNSNLRTFVEAKIQLNLESKGLSMGEFLLAGQRALFHGLEQAAAISDGLDDPDRGIRIAVENPNLYGGYRSTKSRPLHDLESVIREAASILANARQSERDLGTSDDDEADIRLEDTTFHIIRQGPLRLGAKPPRLHLAKRSKRALSDFAAIKRCCVNPLEPGYHLARMAKKFHNLCLPGAIVLGKHLADYPENNLKTFHRSLRKYGFAITQLMQDVGLDQERGPLVMSQQLLDKFYSALGQDYHIICYSNSRQPLYACGSGDETKSIILFFDLAHSHCYLVKDVAAFWNKRRASDYIPILCRKCFDFYNKARGHKCHKQSKCPLCQDVDCTNKENQRWYFNRVTCKKCNRHFFSKECLAVHEALDKALCALKPVCSTCGIIHKSNSKCGWKMCDACKRVSPWNHKCFMLSDNLMSTRAKPTKPHWYADIETYRDPATGHQKPILIHAEDHTGENEVTFFGTDCIKQFLFEAPQMNNSYIVFHNLKGFDGHLILRTAIEEGIDCQPLFRGQEILSLELPHNGMSMRDSLLFIQNAKLANLPKMYSLTSRKGWYPHTLTADIVPNMDLKFKSDFFKDGLIGFPSLEYYEPDKMSSKEKSELKTWHSQQVAEFEANPGLKYDIKAQLETYCKSDVQVLREAFETFLLTFKEKFEGIDVLASITTPSLVNKVFRNHFLAPESIALLPPTGYQAKSSGKELAWLAWMKKQLGLASMINNRNSTPISIGGYKIDGLGQDHAGKLFVFEFLGCFHHGCDDNSCKFNSQKNPTLHCENFKRSRQVMTQLKTRHLRSLSLRHDTPYGTFEYVQVWEHDFHLQQEQNKEMKAFVQAYIRALRQGVATSEQAYRPSAIKSYEPPLSLRDSLFGGRTEVFSHQHSNESIGYYDFTSLYPSVNACTEPYQFYPLGHPNIYIGLDIEQELLPILLDKQEDRLDPWYNFFGVVYCQVLPPKSLKIPVLPMLCNGKLMFPLCRTCAEKSSSSPCQHSDIMRALKGTYCSPEVMSYLYPQFYMV